MTKFISLILLATACTGGGSSVDPATSKVSSIDVTGQRFGRAVDDHTIFTYQGSHLERVAFTRAGGDDSASAITYGASGPIRFEHTDRNGAPLWTEELVYEGDLLASERSTFVGGPTIDTMYTYDRERLLGARTNVVFAGQPPSTTILALDYDGKGRTTKETATTPDETITLELHYNSDGLIESTVLRNTADVMDANTFRYVDGRLDEVLSDTDHYKVSYDDGGRIVEIRRTGTDDALTYRYTYVDGDVEGIVLAPDMLPSGMFFDLGGAPTPVLSTRVRSFTP